MDWNSTIQQYTYHLQLEKALSSHSVAAYKSDIRKVATFFKENKANPVEITRKDLLFFLENCAKVGLSPKSQSRLLSSIRSFFSFLRETEALPTDPSLHIQAPRMGRYLPEVLSLSDIENLLSAIDMSAPMGHRDRAIVETLYASGLRVSELVGLHVGHLYFDRDLVQVLGKGSKERLVPLGSDAQKHLKLYLEVRKKLPRQTGHTHWVFLNNQGKKLSRTSVFLIIKRLVRAVGSRSGSVRILCATVLLRILSKQAPICALCSKCWVIAPSLRLKFTRTWTSATSARWFSHIILAPKACIAGFLDPFCSNSPQSKPTIGR